MTDWTGGPVGSLATCVLAPNPGPMTLDGTNTWVLAAPGSDQAVVLDPGPLDEAHLRTVRAVATRGGRGVAAVLLSHAHPDHADGLDRFAALAGAPVRRLADGEVVAAGGVELRAVATSGHTADSVCFLLTGPGDEPALLTGDTVLGRGTSVVAHPDGVLRDYLDSLERLRALAAAAGVGRLLPGHGPPLDAPEAVLAAYLTHRAERLDQVRAALAAGARTPAEVVDAAYAGLDPAVRAAAEQSVRAQLAYLRE